MIIVSKLVSEPSDRILETHQKTDSLGLSSSQQPCNWCSRQNVVRRKHVEMVLNVDVVLPRDFATTIGDCDFVVLASLTLLSGRSSLRKMPAARLWLRQRKSGR